MQVVHEESKGFGMILELIMNAVGKLDLDFMGVCEVMTGLQPHWVKPPHLQLRWGQHVAEHGINKTRLSMEIVQKWLVWHG